MYKVGITGGIGSGKSTICKVFQQLGISVYDADQRGKALLRDDQQIKEKVVAALGPECYLKDGSVNRSYLGKLVFTDSKALEQLNSIVHPALRNDFNVWLHQQHGPYALEEAAILIESGAYRDMDEVIVVEATAWSRIKRAMERDQADEGKIRNRMDAQLTDEQRRPYADHIIKNDDEDLVIPQILAIHENLVRRPGR